ncbi:hypothetical protein SHJG_5540 [Streptomyces hygroscopicus subsp. jinggangensis 5008]|nr:hypothetical protein SHJG_5540 [Streptomyces hygroscopicus subsp. jinggangensis 5008]AGF64966.1 hypothetical protein SHJGH_5303 [Streptomyces hygroscopicus subsp. jinggangensis TL01]
MTEAREHTRGNVQDAHERGGPADHGGDGLGARAAQYAPRPA